MHHLDWYNNQKVKQKDASKRNSVFLVNQGLKQVLQKLQSFINRDDYVDDARRLGRNFQSSIWNVGYANDMENEHVALAQASLISIVLHREPLPHSSRWKEDVERYMRQLSIVAPTVYMNYKHTIRGLS